MAEPDAPHAPAFRHAPANHPCLGAVCADPVGAPPVSPKFIRASSGETVLLVEDQDDVRNLSLRILEREGYVVLPPPRARPR